MMNMPQKLFPRVSQEKSY